MPVPIVSMVGYSGSGKTTLLERLIPELKHRGLKLAVIKHDAHRFEIDVPGKDTWRLRQAGAEVVAICSTEKLAIMEQLEREIKLDDLVSRLPSVDLVLTEGYKRGDKPKVEVHRRELGPSLLCTLEDGLIAVASDEPLEAGVPVFDLNDATSLADFLLRFLCLKSDQ